VTDQSIGGQPPSSQENCVQERLGIAGAGAIGCGLAVTAARAGQVVLWARSPASAQRARASVDKAFAKISEDLDTDRVQITTELEELGDATYLVEAVVEHHGSKADLLSQLSKLARADTVFATTTSSLSISELAKCSGHPDRFVGLHVFNPVPRMKLIELAFTEEASEQTRYRTVQLCEALGKTPVIVPDIPGFVVNRLLFPYLFSAVELLSQTGMSPEDIDQCMTRGAGMPMGPLALLDFVGLDVSAAIGEEIGVTVPQEIVDLVDEGALGRKAGRGFFIY
jgi:3-hydroxybutyryl-CoA dehydrogenase